MTAHRVTPGGTGVELTGTGKVPLPGDGMANGHLIACYRTWPAACWPTSGTGRPDGTADPWAGMSRPPCGLAAQRRRPARINAAVAGE